jgi:PadR family transcriptional regulator PadR
MGFADFAHQAEAGGVMDTSQLLKGVLDLAVLAVLRKDDGYGYDVVRRLRAGGLNDVGDASVYGTLRRLYNAGMLTSYVVPSEEGPHRKYYSINETGRVRLAESREMWRSFASTLNGLLEEVAA